MAPGRDMKEKHVERDFSKRDVLSSVRLHRHSTHHSAPEGYETSSTNQIRSPAGAPIPHSSLYLAIGVGVGGLLAIVIVIVAAQVFRKRRAHKRELSALAEDRVTNSIIQEYNNVHASRPLSTSRWSTLVTWHNKAGWASFPSEESIREQERLESAIAEPRRSRPGSRRSKQKGLPLKKMRHLSAITESPRSKTSKSPFFGELATPTITEPLPGGANPSIKLVDQTNDADDVFAYPASPKPDVVPSYATTSPGRYGVAIATNERMKPVRPISVGALRSDQMASSDDGWRLVRPQMHSRSISLGGPRTRPPLGPVPPLPLRTAEYPNDTESNRQGLLVRKASCSSQGSANSSVFVTSPILQVRSQNKDDESRSVEEIVAEDDFAKLKNVRNKQWQDPRVNGSRNVSHFNHNTGVSHRIESIRSNLAHFSTEPAADRRVSSSSSISSKDSRRSRRSSVPQMVTANRVSLSRISSTNSFNSIGGVKTVVTPKKSRTVSVSAFGSPAQRNKLSVLRDISGNASPLPREPSACSTSSSNGNPFKWDMPLQKPSALKGSPNARKGHRRQNCVRISTLTPQVLGPPPNRATSPNIMSEIEEEEGSDGASGQESLKRTFISSQRTSRPISAMSLSNNLRVQTLRASLTPSSPTLSQWASNRYSGLPSQPSGSLPSVSPRARTVSRASDHSSLYSIPTFPSPSKTTTSAIQCDNPVPQFCLSRPSTDDPEEDDLSAFGLELDSSIPSSPPLFYRGDDEYDPDWRMVTIPIPDEPEEYDPISPTVWDSTRNVDASPSPKPLISGQRDVTVSGGSPNSRLTSYGGELPDTPPHSPDMPEGFQDFFDKKDVHSKPLRASQAVTSANASSVMARVSVVDFAGAPVLPPPSSSPSYVPPRAIARPRAASDVAHLKPMRPAPAPPRSPLHVDMPSPLHIKSTVLNGPRSEPAKSVLKNAMALRRMNSEKDNTYDRESRCYVRLGREASVQLPLYNHAGLTGSRVDLFDFGFDATSGADQDGPDLENIEMSELDRRTEGALAGFGGTTSSGKKSSVWEDAENFWHQKQRSLPESGFMPSSPIDIKSTPTQVTLIKSQDQLVTPVTKLQMPKLNVNRSSPYRVGSAKTPKSLYDGDGFLRA